MNVNTRGQRVAGTIRWQRGLRLLLLFLASALAGEARLHGQCPTPTITCAPNKTVECGTIWTNDPPFVVDSCCGPGYTLTYSAVTSGICPHLIAFKWVLTNCFTNTASCTQTVTVVDTMPPGIFCTTNKTVMCTTPWTFDTPTNFDLCCGTNVTLRILGTATSNVGCTMFATRSWQAVDCCSNVSAICTQMVTVIETAPPMLTCAPNKTVECGTAWVFDPPTALTCCGTNAAVTTIGTFTNSGACTQMLARVWQAASCCGPTTVMCTQMVTVVDTTPPFRTHVAVRSASQLIPVFADKATSLGFFVSPNLAPALTPRLIGMNGELSTVALPLKPGKKFTVYVAGEGIDEVPAAGISSTSPFISIDPDSVSEAEFDTPYPAISFEITVARNIPAGEYSILLQSVDGEIVYLVGALTIDEE